MLPLTVVHDAVRLLVDGFRGFLGSLYDDQASGCLLEEVYEEVRAIVWPEAAKLTGHDVGGVGFGAAGHR